MADATIKQVTDFFGMKLAEFRDEWQQLSDDERQQIRQGIGDGSLTY